MLEPYPVPIFTAPTFMVGGAVFILKILGSGIAMVFSRVFRYQPIKLKRSSGGREIFSAFEQEQLL